MGGWHREHPELVGTDADPWMIHESYRRFAPVPEAERDLLRDEREANTTDVAASPVTPTGDEMTEPRDAGAMMPHIFGQEQ